MVTCDTLFFDGTELERNFLPTTTSIIFTHMSQITRQHQKASTSGLLSIQYEQWICTVDFLDVTITLHSTERLISIYLCYS